MSGKGTGMRFQKAEKQGMAKKGKRVSLFFLFSRFFQIALCVVGGGLAMVPLIEDVFVCKKRVLTHEDMLDMVAIMQTMPGMMAVNAAIFVGHRLAGFMGAAVAIIGVILPSVGIMMGIAAVFQSVDVQNPHMLQAFSCVRACVAAIFLGTAIRLVKSVFRGMFDYVIVGAFMIALLCGFSQIALIIMSVPIGWAYVLYQRRQGGQYHG